MPFIKTNEVRPNGMLIRSERMRLGMKRPQFLELINEKSGLSVSYSTLQRAEQNFTITEFNLKLIAKGLGHDNIDFFTIKSAPELITVSEEYKVAFEAYQVTDRIEMKCIDKTQFSGRVSLVNSSVTNAQGFMDVSIDQKLKADVHRYSFNNSFSHLLFAPGKSLVPSIEEETVNSNGYQFKIDYEVQTNVNLIPSLVDHILFDKHNLVQVESMFSYSPDYTGPKYKKRILIFARGIGIIYCKVIYSDERWDTVFLDSFNINKNTDDLFPVTEIDNKWLYIIHHQTPYNITNMSE